jgi:hypothetical protein
LNVDQYASDDIIRAACDLLVWYEHGLRTQSELRGLLDSWAADETARSVGQIATLLAGQAERVLIDPQTLYRELDIDRFTGREWLLCELAEFLGSHPHGCFVLEGPAGVGKSTFLAWLARQRGYIQHFVQLADGRDDTGAALSNLSAQLVNDWALDDWPAPLLGPAVQPHEFQQLLERIAQERNRRRPGRQIVLVIDGLNEATTPAAGRNVLGLPHSLPDGVFLVVSQQFAPVALNIRMRYPCELLAGDDRNLDDLRRYLQTATERAAIAAAINSSSFSAQQLVDALLDKSGGVWLYVYFILTELERGTRSLENLDDLPAGLWQYYIRHWRARHERHRERWEHCDVPLLTTLAVAQEPITLTTLQALATIDNDDRIAEVIADWQPFLEPVEVEPPAYRLYHPSFRAFLTGEATEGLLRAERQVAAQLSRQARLAHKRIAIRYGRAWKDVVDHPPRLQDGCFAAMDEGYGLRHLVAHLAVVDAHDTLRELILTECPSDPRPLNAWYTAHAQDGDHTRYLTDITRSLRVAQTVTDRSMITGEPAISVGDEFGYAVLAASINSQIGNVSSELRVALVQRGTWSPSRGVADARQLSDSRHRADALGALIPKLCGEQREEALTEALAAARAITDEFSRGHALAALVVHLSGVEHDRALTEALMVARAATTDEQAGVRLIASLAAQLSGTERDRTLAEAFTIASGIPDQGARAGALAALAPYLNATQVDAALDAVRAVAKEAPSAHALGALATRLRGAERDRVLAEALTAARAISSEASRAHALGMLAVHLRGAERDRALAEALIAARATTAASRPNALGALATQLHGSERDRVLTEALTAARSTKGKRARGRAFGALAAHLNDTQLNDALIAASSITDAHSLTYALIELSTQLFGTARDQALTEALSAARTITPTRPRVDALTKIAPLLQGEERDQACIDALSAAQDIADESSRAHALGTLAAHLNETQLAEALTITCAISDESVRARTLAKLAAPPNVNELEEPLTAAPSTTRESSPADEICKLAEDLHATQLSDALTAARAFTSKSSRAMAVGALGAQLHGNERDQILTEALTTASAITSEFLRANALGALATHLDATQLDGALIAARAITDDALRARALGALAVHIRGENREQALTEALTAARAITRESSRVRALTAIANYLNSAQLDDALTAARAITDDALRARALGALAVHIHGDNREQALTEALTAARAITRESSRVGVLAALAPSLSNTQLEDALATARAITDNFVRIRAFGSLAAQLRGETRDRTLTEALTIAYSMTSESSRANALGHLAAHLNDSQLKDAVTAAQLMTNAVYRLQALTALVSRPETARVVRTEVWRDLLASAAIVGRPQVSKAVSAVLPVIVSLGGPPAVERMLVWLLAAARWWP